MPPPLKVVVIGAGPGGYAAAFRAADLGLEVSLVSTEGGLGGTCLHQGCIPSKALLHIAKVITESREAKKWGLEFGAPKIDLQKIQAWKEGVVQKMTGGLHHLCQQRKINYIPGRASFIDPHTLQVTSQEGRHQDLHFDNAIIATGSCPATLPDLMLKSPRFLDSTSALNLKEIPKTLLVIGGGYIGLELGFVYASLGSQVSLVEMTTSLLPGVDRDLVRPLAKRLGDLFQDISLKTQVKRLGEKKGDIEVVFEGEGKNDAQTFSHVLMAVGRKPHTDDLNLGCTRVKTDDKGFIEVDAKRRTNEPHIFAIGDVAGPPMLAHKATHEGCLVAQVIAKKDIQSKPKAVPAVVFTDPEIAWCGLMETEAKEQGLKVQVVRFPWMASGRAATLDRQEGHTKLILNPETGHILGVGIVGPGASELIAEGVLAIEMGAKVGDLSSCIHPHPTLSETLKEAAEIFHGLSTHLYRPIKPEV
ncbi:MAG: dihydrolipoyl dehydrogenase [Deltaproteobacteria bacterium RIFCSPLOWO2_02_FULL_50_16]|nr:MAG: dihydrolipoyl dehydrogenase [Deltaproteobacteria bacterium RIFCSPHIGHO2_02_FULL_50_15]OGQ58035.1 MAG: dihydrolipoyl dehydrogenase [Deltaproteobacteria bacterium RIFCSPLOWO2_02_FULL_50_16]OGQ69056.1 MAG: dihydrolipoyl dehydrogenase [Deltaproteobacteria bacterium RIFCSPLOWO2_12_FULL_50_11]